MTSSHFYAVPKINSFTRSCGLRSLSMPSSRNEEAKTTSTPGSQAPSAYHARRARNSSSRHQKSFQQRHPLAAASNFFPLPLKAYITWPRSTSAALLMWYPKPVLPLPAARRAESVASTLLLPQPHTPTVAKLRSQLATGHDPYQFRRFSPSAHVFANHLSQIHRWEEADARGGGGSDLRTYRCRC